MKYLIPLIFTFALLPFQSKSQLDTFNLSSYKLPEMKRKGLDFNFNFSEQGKFTEENSSYAKHFSLESAFNTTYHSFYNSARKQNNQSLSLAFDHNFYRYKQEAFTGIDKSWALSSTIFYSNISRFYKESYFIEPDLELYFNYMGRNGDNNQNNSMNISINVPLLVGKGRIEQVQDARHAIYIVEELLRQNRLSLIPDGEAIIELAEAISKIKNERFFDARLKQIYEIEALDSILRTMNLVSHSDARYFTTLYDNWIYSDPQIRESGKRISIGIEPGYSYSFSNQESDNHLKQTFNSYSLAGVFKYEFHKPINLKWQRGTSFKFRGGYFYQDHSNHIEKVNIKAPKLNVHATYSIGFFPNSRTEFTYYLNAGSSYFNGYRISNDVETVTSIFDVYVNGNLKFYYYISPQFRFSGTCSHHVQYNEQKNYDLLDYSNFSQNIILGLNYSLF